MNLKVLEAIIGEARALLQRTGNDFSWSSWQDLAQATAELDGIRDRLSNGGLDAIPKLQVLFTPTGPIQEVAESSGWGAEFLALADRLDEAAKPTKE